MPPHPSTSRARPVVAARSRGAGPLVRTATAATVTAVVLGVAGCAAVPEKNQQPIAPSSSATAEGVEPELQRFYSQAIEWSVCGDFQCGTAAVPIDYSDPGAGSIELALKRAPATGGDPMGSLLINPGGPGGSGVEFLESAVGRISERVLEAYDTVGFDPRGVGLSAPVTCLDDDGKDALISRDFDLGTDAGLAEAREAYRAFAEACATNTGPLLGHVDTGSAARDLDVLRAALGDESLTYLGYSYGTALGATYAELFPDRAGRLVLDGGIDPALDPAQVGLEQAVGFESALRAYVADCQAGSDCPLTGTVDQGLAQIRDLLERARRDPLPTDSDRVLTGSLAFYGIAVTLYDDQNWGALTQGLTAALRGGDGSILLLLADAYNERGEDGTYLSNSTEAFTAVNCLDGASSADPETMRAEAAELAEAAPTVGYYFGYGGLVCAEWPYPPTGEAGPITAEGAPPILVIGTTNDPATPYAWSVALAEQLSSGVLLTYEGEGHTAYGRSNECITDAVDEFLLEGTVPADGTRC